VTPVVLVVAYVTAALLEGLLGKGIGSMRHAHHADGAHGRQACRDVDSRHDRGIGGRRPAIDTPSRTGCASSILVASIAAMSSSPGLARSTFDNHFSNETGVPTAPAYETASGGKTLAEPNCRINPQQQADGVQLAAARIAFCARIIRAQ
jgi:hypothetical protein